jgi:hypothetical protein
MKTVLFLALLASTAYAGDPTGGNGPYSNQNYLGARRYYPPQGTPVNPYVVITPDGRRFQVQAGPNPYLPQGTDLNPYRVR